MTALGVDPAPGDPAAVRAVALRLRHRASSLRAEAEALASLARSSWEGAAAASFTGLALTLPEDLRRSAEASELAARALEVYGDVLAGVRAVVPGLRARAEAASSRCGDGLLASAPSSPFAALDPAALEAERERRAALHELAALRREALRLRGALEDAGRAAARTVEDARDLLPERPPLLGRAAEGVADVAEAAWGEVEELAARHAETVEVVADLISVAALVATVGAVVCPPLAAVATGARVVGWAARGVRAASVVNRAAPGVGAAVNATVVAGTDKPVTALWPDLLALGTLGASRALTAPTRAVGGPAGRWNIATARAADARLPATSGWTRPSTWTAPAAPRTAGAPSVWAHEAAMGSNELVMRSVRFAVDAPSALVGTAGGVAAARTLHRRVAGPPAGPPARPQQRAPSQRADADRRRQEVP